jgi:hypothetical protein
MPSTLLTSLVTTNTVSLAWTETGTATSWEVIALPCGTAPSNTSIGTNVTTNPFVFTGLLPGTCYNLYVKSVCSLSESSFWSIPVTVTTELSPPVCGGTFIDNGGLTANYANSSDITYVICPSTAGEMVSVIFNSFDTEANWDGLYVYNGNSITAPQISSTNPAANVPGGLPGAFWGTSIPEVITSSSPDGCLTFRFRSDSICNLI